MWSGNALADARDLARSPSLARHLRQRALPPDVLTVIQLAWGCADTIRIAELSTGCDASFLKAAGELYIREVLCFEGADPFRTLGVQPHAPREQMRLHMRHLMLCLHPDRSPSPWQAASATRVLSAWRDLNRRSATEKFTLVPAEAKRPVRSQIRSYKPPWVARPVVRQKPAALLPTATRHALRIAILLPALLCPGPHIEDEAEVPNGTSLHASGLDGAQTPGSSTNDAGETR